MDTEQISEEFGKKLLILGLQDLQYLINNNQYFKSEYFSHPLHKLVADICLYLIKMFGTIPNTSFILDQIYPANISDRLEDLRQHVIEFFETAEKLNISRDRNYIKKHIFKYVQEQKFNKNLLLSQDITRSGGDISEVLKTFKYIANMKIEAPDIGTFLLGDYKQHINIIRSGEDKPETISTGNKELDKILDGGWARGTLNVLIGPPNRGKSLFKIAFGKIAMVLGYNVFHYSLEMSETRVRRRYTANITGYPKNELEDYVDAIEGQMAECYDKYPEDVIIKKYPQGEATVLDLHNHIGLIRDRFNIKPDLVIVDYADILSLPKASEHRHQLNLLYRDLRALGFKHNAAVLTSSQGTKSSEKKEVIEMGDANEDFRKAANSDVMIGLSQTAEEYEEKRMRLFITKNREGEKNVTVSVFVNYDLQRVTQSF